MKLYYNPQSRAAIAKWMLDECSAKYEIVPIDFAKREHKTPEFLKINPAGKLPALVDGDSKVFEGAAICLYLGDKFPEANLAPKIGAPERGRYLSLMVYSTSQLEPARETRCWARRRCPNAAGQISRRSKMPSKASWPTGRIYSATGSPPLM
jgi:glutathione S-transferase